MYEGRQPRGVTTCPRSAQWQRVPGCDGTGMAERSYPTSKVRGSGREEQLHVQGAVAVQAQEGLEELFHVQGQERRQGGDNPFPR